MLASSVLFKRGDVRFDASLRYSGDWVALLNLSLKGPAAYVDETLMYWRIHDENSHIEALKTFPYSTVCATPIAHSYMAFHQRK